MTIIDINHFIHTIRENCFRASFSRISHLEWFTATIVIFFTILCRNVCKKHNIPISVTERDRKWMVIFFRNLQMWLLYWFHAPFSLISPVQWSMQTSVIFLTILCRNLLNNHKIQFLVTKRGQKIDDDIYFWIFICDLCIDFMPDVHVPLLWNDLRRLV